MSRRRNVNLHVKLTSVLAFHTFTNLSQKNHQNWHFDLFNKNKWASKYKFISWLATYSELSFSGSFAAGDDGSSVTHSSSGRSSWTSDKGNNWLGVCLKIKNKNQLFLSLKPGWSCVLGGTQQPVLRHRHRSHRSSWYPWSQGRWGRPRGNR